MSSFEEMLRQYGPYHQDCRNKRLHFIGVPLVLSSLLVPLSWFRLLHFPSISLGIIVYACLLLYYLRVEVLAALVHLPFGLSALGIAEWVAQLPWRLSLAGFALLSVCGWTAQLVGHIYEGRRPALADNLQSALTGPLFLATELLFSWGWRPELHARLLTKALETDNYSQ